MECIKGAERWPGLDVSGIRIVLNHQGFKSFWVGPLEPVTGGYQRERDMNGGCLRVVLEIRMCPPASSTIFWTILKPNPVPCCSWVGCSNCINYVNTGPLFLGHTPSLVLNPSGKQASLTFTAYRY